MADTKDLKSFEETHKGSTPLPRTNKNMEDFKSGDRIRMKYFEGYATGEITIVTETECKVIFDGDFDLDYWYYPKKDLEIIETKEK